MYWNYSLQQILLSEIVMLWYYPHFSFIYSISWIWTFILVWKTQLLPPPTLSVMISHVTLNILLPSRRVFLSSELKRPSILKTLIFKNLSVLFPPTYFLLIIWEYHTIHPITLDSHSSQVHPLTLAPSPQNRQKEKLKKKKPKSNLCCSYAHSLEHGQTARGQPGRDN